MGISLLITARIGDDVLQNGGWKEPVIYRLYLTVAARPIGQAGRCPTYSFSSHDSNSQFRYDDIYTYGSIYTSCCISYAMSIEFEAKYPFPMSPPSQGGIQPSYYF